MEIKQTLQSRKLRRIHSLWWFVVIGVVFSLIILLITGYSLNQVERRLRQQAVDTLRFVLHSTHKNMRNIWLDGLFKDTLIRASDPLFVANVERLLQLPRIQKDLITNPVQESIREHFRDMLKRHDALGVFIIAPDNISLASMRDENIGTTNLIAINRGSRLEKVLKGENQFIPPIRSDVLLQDEHGNMVMGYPTMFIAVPVRDGQGQVIATLTIRLNPFASFTQIAQTGQIWNSGETYLFDRDALFLSESRFVKDLRARGLLGKQEHSILNIKLRVPNDTQDEALWPLTFMAKSATAGKSGSSVDAYQDYRAVAVLGAWFWDEELEVGFAAEVDESEALSTHQFVLNVMNQEIVVIVLLCLILILILYRLQKRVMFTIRESEIYLSVVMDNAAAGIINIDSSANIVTFNRSAEDLFGYSSKEVMGKNVKMLANESDKNNHDMYINNYLKTGVANIIGVGREVIGRRKDGSHFPVHLAISDNLVGNRRFFTCVINDLTEHKQLEEQLHKLNQAVEQSRSSIFIVDQKGNIEYVNPAYCEKSGYTSEEVLGRDMRTFKSKNTTEEKYNEIWETINAGNDWSGEINNMTKSGTFLWESVIISPVRNASGEISHFLGVKDDISKRKQAEKDIAEHTKILEKSRQAALNSMKDAKIQSQRAKQALEELALSQADLEQARKLAVAANAAKSNFLATMSHEIRTPMNGVVGMIDLLSQTSLDADQRQMTDTIRGSAFALLQIIDDILDFTKIEAGKMSLERVPISICDVIEGVAETLAPNASHKGIKFLVYVDPQIPDLLLSDQVRLRQILFNLSGNAIKFTNNVDNRSGRVVIRADVDNTIKADDVQLRISVSDNGIGMDKDVVNSLFEPFTQADNATTRKFGGTGLGLSICKRMTELMGGEIFVDSKKGEGSTFVVTIKLAYVEKKDRITGVLTAQELVGVRVLVVSQDPELTGFLLHYLQHWQASYQHTADLNLVLGLAQEAALSEHAFDVVVLDDSWLQMDRDIVRQHFLDHPVLKKIHFVILSNRTEKLTTQQFPDSIILRSNPLRRSNFIKAIATAVGRAHSEPLVQDTVTTLADIKPPSVEQAEESGQLVLVVEDNEINQLVLQRQINLLGYATEIANNGKEALALWQRRNYALILTDCNMPEMDGFEFTKTIRNDQKTRNTANNTPIIAITANAFQSEIDHCLAAGMDDYLAKPVELMQLRRMLEKWMGGVSNKKHIIQ